MTSDLYTPADVENWLIADLDLVRRMVGSRGASSLLEHGPSLRELHEIQMCLSMAAIAKSDFGLALGHVAAACEIWCRLVENFPLVTPMDARLIGSDDFRVLLRSHVIPDPNLVNRTANVYERVLNQESRLPVDQRRGGSESSAFGETLLRLTRREAVVDLGSSTGLGVRVAGESDEPSVIYYDSLRVCLEAVPSNDEPEFVERLVQAEAAWREYARLDQAHLPESVCFIDGCALVRLFAWVHGQTPPMKLAWCPPELLSAVPEPTEWVPRIVS